MKNLIVEEICKNLKWYERAIVKLFKKLTYKVYRMGMISYFNYANK